MILSRTLIFVCITGSFAFCPHEYVSANDGFCYKKTAVKGRFDDMEDACNHDGAHLASIHSSFEMGVVRGLMNVSMFYIGMTSNHGSRTWTWLDGTPMDYIHSDLGYCAAEWCVGFVRHDGSWSGGDWNVDYNVPGVCRIREDANVYPCYDYSPVPNVTDSNYNTSCFRAHFEPMTHDDAEKKCQSECGHLAIIHAKEVNTALLYATSSYSGTFTIGLSNTMGSVYQWSDGTYLNALDYTNFGIVDSSLGKCVVMTAWHGLSNILPGEWESAECDTPRPFFCTRVPGRPCNIQ